MKQELLKILRLLIILFLLDSYSYGQSGLELLEKAYKKNSVESLDSFLHNWHLDSKPIMNLDTLSDLERDVYEIFIDFYNPFDLSKYGASEWGDDIYSPQDYAVIQDYAKIYLYKTDSLNVYFNDSIIDLETEIVNFRPNVNIDNKKILILDNCYDSILNSFLGSDNYPLGHKNIMSPARARKKSAKRQKFIENRIKIFHGHWGGYWHIISHPVAYSFSFNRDRTLARVSFMIIYEGGSAYYYKKGDKWIFKEAKITWIE